jgi:branched-chain amino acid transport system permease protein
MQTDWKLLLRDAVLSALIALLLFGHLVGLRTVEQSAGLAISTHWTSVGVLAAAVFIGRIVIGLLYQAHSRRAPVAKTSNPQLYTYVMLGLLAAAIVLPFTPLSSRYVLDVLTLIFTYMVLASGLNVVVGMTGLLDLGFAAFYAIGAYAFSLLALNAGLSFWEALPFSILLSALIAGVIGLIVLRLRGDYLAIVTLGFAEILRIVLLNWVSLTGGPNGITGIPRPDFFGHIITEPAQRVMFLYYLAIFFFIVVALIMARLRRLPIGRAFEAVREDELAAQAAGINLTLTKLAAYMVASCCGALAGAFFAARQGFVSPESFTFTESALVLAIVVLAGMGHPLGLMLAAAFLVGLPELFRELQDYRLIAFGAGMVLIMIWRPQGLFAQRSPVVTLEIK